VGREAGNAHGEPARRDEDQPWLQRLLVPADLGRNRPVELDDLDGFFQTACEVHGLSPPVAATTTRAHPGLTAS
jgi:hypothetical protein